MRSFETLSTLLRYANTCKKQENLGFFAQAYDLAAMKIQAGIGLTEYFELRVFNRPRSASSDRWIGRRRSHRIDRVLNANAWRAIANDKVLTYTLLNALGLPTPKTFAVVSTSNRRMPGVAMIASKDQLRELFCNTDFWPAIAKPVIGSFGKDTFQIDYFDREADTCLLHSGEALTLDDLYDIALRSRRPGGMLMQEKLVPHAKVRELAGETIGCGRFIVMNDGEHVWLHDAYWKIARVSNVTDNFASGRHGNLMAEVDLDSGRIKEVIGGFWPMSEPLESHPDTGERFDGFILPKWREAVQLCLSAAALLPGLGLQNWDVAFSTDGPVLLEVNTESPLHLVQFLRNRPFIDEKLAAFLAQKGAGRV